MRPAVSLISTSARAQPVLSSVLPSIKRSYSRKTNPQSQQLKAWPFIFIFFAGIAGYIGLVKQRTGR